MEYPKLPVSWRETKIDWPLPRLHVLFDREISVEPSLHFFSWYTMRKESTNQGSKWVMKELGKALTVTLDRTLTSEDDRRVFVRSIDVFHSDKARFAAAALLAMMPEVEYQDLVLASGTEKVEPYVSEAWTWITRQGFAVYTNREGFQALPLYGKNE
jgi:hypothetical protein